MTGETPTPNVPDRADESGVLPRRREQTAESEADGAISGGDTYRIVTDLVVGPNLRWRDNLFQAIFIFITLVLSVAVGGVFWGVEGAAIGGLGGLIGGLLLSGAALGAYRAYRHLQGRHK